MTHLFSSIVWITHSFHLTERFIVDSFFQCHFKSWFKIFIFRIIEIRIAAWSKTFQFNQIIFIALRLTVKFSFQHFCGVLLIDLFFVRYECQFPKIYKRNFFYSIWTTFLWFSLRKQIFWRKCGISKFILLKTKIVQTV